MPVSSLSSVSRERPVAGGDRLHQQPRGFVAAVHHQAVHRLTLDERLGIAQERDEILQAFGATELAKEIGRGAPDFPVLRAHQPLNRLAPLGAEPDQDIAQPAPGACVLLGRESLGQRGYHRRTDGVAERLEPFVGLVIRAPEMRGHVPHHRAPPESLERRGRVRSARRDTLALADNDVGELPGLIEVADPDQVLGMGGGGLGDVAPACRLGLDRQQIEQQLMIQAAQGRVGDRSQPHRNAFRRIVADRLDLGGARPRVGQLAAVLFGHILLVRIRGQHPFDALPERLQPLATGFGRRDLVVRPFPAAGADGARRAPAPGTRARAARWLRVP